MLQGINPNMAPTMIMKAIVETLLSQKIVKEAMSPDIVNIFVNKSVALATYMKDYLSHFWLKSSNLEHSGEEMKVLGWEVSGEDNILQWKWGNAVPNISDPIMP